MKEALKSLTLYNALERSAKAYENSPALSNLGEEPITYRELHNSVVSLSNWLSAQGVGFGDRVTILGENSPQWGIAYLAITTMGAIAVPILNEFHSDAITHIIRHSEAKVIFVSEKLFPKIEDKNFSPPPLFVNLETFTPFTQHIGIEKLSNLKKTGLREFWKWKKKAMTFTKKIPVHPNEDDIASIIYTSGTTGHSKGVMLTHKNIVSNAYSVESIFSIGDNDRIISLLPMSHTFECTLGLVLPLLNGAHVFYLGKPPTARILQSAFSEVKPTAMLFVPLIIEKIFKSNILPKLTKNWLLDKCYKIPLFRRAMNYLAGKKFKAFFGGKIRIVAIGGAPLAPDVENFLADSKFPYTVGYGMTETSPILSASSPFKTKRRSSGQPLVGVSLKIDSPNPETGEGEILAKGPNIMKGYFKSPEITASVFTEDNWLKTGDLGYIDDNNFVYIKGRLKNVLLGPSGENIYPEEIESFLLASPYVLEALVYQSDSKIVARVHLDHTRIEEEFPKLEQPEFSDKLTFILENLKEEVNSKTSSFAKIHKIFEQTEPFEKTPTQKIKRYLYIN